jgi:NADPH:quinone reductase-like Zn-dependent oxidoreductase
MKAILLQNHGSAENLIFSDEVPMPQLNENYALIKIGATGINRADLVIRNGYPGLSIPLPHILGGDITGTIEEITGNPLEFSVGDRVISMPLITIDRNSNSISGFNLPEHQHLSLDWKYFGMHIKGSYAEYAAVPVNNLVALPDNVSFESASTLCVAGLTSYHAIHGVGKIQSGETYLIWGGASALGTIAIQLAKSAGAKIIATAGSPEKMNVLTELGADFVFNHYSDDVVSEVKKLFPFGIDVILDYIGPATFPKSFELVKKGGRILLCGIMTGRESNLNLHMTYLRHISIHGLYLGTKEEMTELVKLTADGSVKPVIYDTLPLSDAAKAHKIVEENENTGKVVMIP